MAGPPPPPPPELRGLDTDDCPQSSPASTPVSASGGAGCGGSSASPDLDRLRVDNGMLHAKLNSRQAIITALLEDIAKLEAVAEAARALDMKMHEPELDTDPDSFADFTGRHSPTCRACALDAALAAAGGPDGQ